MVIEPWPAVPKAFPGETLVCIGGGPSLTREDVEYCRDKARVICINDAIRLAPWADVLYAADARWWLCHQDTKRFAGQKYGLQPCVGRPDVTVLRKTGTVGLESDPTGLRTGGHSGYQAIGLAVHLGAARILLLGYDLQRGPKGQVHWFGSHVSPLSDPTEAQLIAWRLHFVSLAAPLAALGIDVLNCTPESALRVFRARPLREALCEVPACA